MTCFEVAIVYYSQRARCVFVFSFVYICIYLCMYVCVCEHDRERTPKNWIEELPTEVACCSAADMPQKLSTELINPNLSVITNRVD